RRPAQPQPRLAPCFFRSHPAPHVLLNGHLEVEGQLLIEFAGFPCTGEEGAEAVAEFVEYAHRDPLSLPLPGAILARSPTPREARPPDPPSMPVASGPVRRGASSR